MPDRDDTAQFITRYRSQEDRSKPNRVLDTIKVGEMYVSRLEIEPDVVAGNLYHKQTNAILFVTKGQVRFKFVDVESGASEEMDADPSFGIMHQPPMSAIGIRNIGLEAAIVFFFSNKPLRKDDDYEYPVYHIDSGAAVTKKKPTSAKEMKGAKPMSHYPFKQDRRKEGRLMESVKVGDVWVTRLTIEPGVVTGNLYHKQTNVLLFVTRGSLRFKFEHIETHESKEFPMQPGSGIIHIPTHIAIADKNIGRDVAEVIYFSNNPFRADDDYPYELYRSHE